MDPLVPRKWQCLCFQGWLFINLCRRDPLKYAIGYRAMFDLLAPFSMDIWTTKKLVKLQPNRISWFITRMNFSYNSYIPPKNSPSIHQLYPPNLLHQSMGIPQVLWVNLFRIFRCLAWSWSSTTSSGYPCRPTIRRGSTVTLGILGNFPGLKTVELKSEELKEYWRNMIDVIL